MEVSGIWICTSITSRSPSVSQLDEELRTGSAGPRFTSRPPSQIRRSSSPPLPRSGKTAGVRLVTRDVPHASLRVLVPRVKGEHRSRPALVPVDVSTGEHREGGRLGDVLRLHVAVPARRESLGEVADYLASCVRRLVGHFQRRYPRSRTRGQTGSLWTGGHMSGSRSCFRLLPRPVLPQRHLRRVERGAVRASDDPSDLL